MHAGVRFALARLAADWARAKRDRYQQGSRCVQLPGVIPAKARPVRYYAARGLVRGRKHPRNGYHRFTDSDMRTLAFVRRAQALGFMPGEIETILAMSRRHESVGTSGSTFEPLEGRAPTIQRARRRVRSE